MPPTRYARSGDVSLAYQDFGKGPVTLVAVPPLARNIELAWESSLYRRYFNRIATFSRYVHFDKRGTGASDRTLPMPSLDTRVEDLKAVMDAAEVDRAFLWGSSEGGPMALVFAATYPDRVEGIVLDGTAAVLVPASESATAREQRLARRERWLDGWGTDRSTTLAFMAPSVASDPWYRAWQPRYERQSATPAALRELITMNDEIDVRPVLSSIEVPTLGRHRVGDRVVPIERARETMSAIRGARLVEFPGDDHFSHIGHEVVGWLGLLEEFVTGTAGPTPRRRARPRPATGRAVTAVQTLGGFAVVVDGVEVPVSSWGSRRARQLCKRLVAAGGQPVLREQLIEFLWPDEVDIDRLGPRLSVQLSAVRRVLGGGVIADREAVRIDPAAIHIDFIDLHAAAKAGDLQRVTELYRGDFLPLDIYEDWATPERERARSTFIQAAHELAAAADAVGDHDGAATFARRILAADHFDEEAHRRLITALLAAGHAGSARQAHGSYTRRMDELGAPSVPLDEFGIRSR